MATEDGDGDGDFVPSAYLSRTAPSSKSLNLRERRTVDYTQERTDLEFAGEKGYTHFHRTRKGGDKRPLGTPNTPKASGPSVTLLNFFGVGNNKPMTMPKKHKRKQLAKSPSPPITRTKWGRRTKTTGLLASKIRKFKAHVARTETAGACSRPPAKRCRWNGTVSIVRIRVVVAFF